AGEDPRSSASNSDLNSPSFVLPKYCEPDFQYLPERVFTQTSLAVVAGAVFVLWTIGAAGLVRKYFLYASIQSEAISRWAVLRSNWHRRLRACGASSQAHLSQTSSRAKFWLIGAKGYERS